MKKRKLKYLIENRSRDRNRCIIICLICLAIWIIFIVFSVTHQFQRMKAFTNPEQSITEKSQKKSNEPKNEEMRKLDDIGPDSIEFFDSIKYNMKKQKNKINQDDGNDFLKEFEVNKEKDISKNYFRYPFIKNKIHEEEIDEFNEKLINDCKFCKYPKYEKIFVFKTHQYYCLEYVSSFISYNGDYLVVLTHFSNKMFLLALKYRVDAKIIYYNERNEQVVIQIECEDPIIGDKSQTVEYKCKLNDKKLLEYCFHVQLYHRGRVVLKKPLLVRHCYNKREDPKYELSVCSVFSSQSTRFILEWIEYHKLVGVEHFYLYVNPGFPGLRRTLDSLKNYKNDLFYLPTFALLDSYILNGEVTLAVWNYTFARAEYFRVDQAAGMLDCIRRYGGKSKWFAMIDDDEYMVPGKNFSTIKESLLSRYSHKRIASLGLSSWLYGPYRKKESELTIDAYPYFLEKLPNGRKVIVSPDNVNSYYTHYILNHRNGSIGRYNVNDEKEARLVHYFYRKTHDINPFITPGVRKKLEAKSKYFFNENKELTIWRFLPELKKKVNEKKNEIGIENFNFKYDMFLNISNIEKYTKYPRCCTHNDVNHLCCRGGMVDRDSSKNCREVWKQWCMKKIFRRRGKIALGL